MRYSLGVCQDQSITELSHFRTGGHSVARLILRDRNHVQVDMKKRRSFFTVGSYEMTRSGLMALSLATLAVGSLTVARAQSAKTETPVAAPAAKVEAAPAAQAEATDARVAKAMAVHILPADVKPEVEQKPEVAAAPTPPAPPVITLVAKVDLTTQRVTVLEHGKAKFTWSISSGARGYNTPTGNFQPGWMAKIWFSKQYDNAPMPHAVFFKDGAAMHATQAIGSLGRPASHGCVRLAPANAATFYSLVARHGLKQTRIQVFGTPRHAPEAVASRVPQRVNMQRVAYAPSSGGGYAGYQGGYQGHGYYVSNTGSAFAKPAASRAQQVRVVHYRSGGVRY
jgi:lipoprotein-anchoring transpeptidase ErfK/SrfK